MAPIFQDGRVNNTTPYSPVSPVCCALATLFLTTQAGSTQAAPDEPVKDFVFREGLVVNAVGRYGRNPFHIDPIEALIVKGQWTPPTAGDVVTGPDGTDRAWQVAAASAEATFTGSAVGASTNRARGGGAYLYIPFKAPADDIQILEATGQDSVYVNGEPRVGDPYGNGILQLPVKLRAGTNDFLFQFSRGTVKARLVTPKSPALLNMRDLTLPDLIRGDMTTTWGAVVVVNCTTNFLADLSLRASCGRRKSVRTALPAIPPLSSRKIGFRIEPYETAGTNVVSLKLDLARDQSRRAALLDSQITSLRLRRPDEHYKQTFRSDIDGSIQYFAVVPAQPPARKRPAQALFLSTHGASVEALGQAACYAPKAWGIVVAPTNRRPYGFDWEDWGRHDALEVLALAQARFKTDPHQTYLTGHSMGGHGAWHLGVTFPDRFAAIAPSAGWISFWSYADSDRKKTADPVQRLLQRAATPGDTLALSSNYLHQGIYILHGDIDDNVPVTEARTMRDQLVKFHRDFVYHEQPGAGHWWGNQCMDWPPIFDLFARHKIPDDESISDINFSTANPGISSSSHWVSIEAQQHALARSAVVIQYDPSQRRFTGTTENVARLALSLNHVGPGGKIAVELDGQKFENIPHSEREQRIWFERADNKWVPGRAPSLSQKGPHRYGPFKEAFGNHMIFVYATKGTAEENAWAYAKARFDAETWWYRGNGSVDVVPDTSFNAVKDQDRGVILYGNADNNSAWPGLLAQSPVQVRRGVVKIGEREQRGEDLACLFCRPRSGSDRASVAVISGSGVTGLKLTDRVPYFMAGVAYPDCTVFGAETLAKGNDGVLVTGYFGNDWSVDKGEFAWRE
jgi:poly(3-hydroxybutyrate) depolymerase